MVPRSFMLNFKVRDKFKISFLFLLGLVIIDLVVSQFLGSLYVDLYSGPGRYNFIKGKKYDCLIMGSSTAKAYYEKTISKELGCTVLNVSLDGSSILYSKCLLEYVLYHNVKPKLLLLNIDLFEVLDSAWGGNYYSNVDKFLPVYGEVPYIDKMLERGSLIGKIKFLSRSYKYNNLIISLIKKKIHNYANTYKRAQPSANTLTLPIPRKIIDKKFSNIYRINNKKFMLYEEFITTCEKNDIKLIFIESPVYYPKGTMIARDKKIESMLFTLANKHNIPFVKINQKKYPVFQSNLLYEDVLHLNYEGGEVFSSIVCDKIKSILSHP